MGWFWFENNYPFVLAQGALTIWMLVDASRRGAEPYWFWIILLFQPFGAWAYCALLITRSFGHRGLASGGPLWQRRVSLAELRYRADRTPTVMNHLTYGERLMERREHKEAMTQLQAAVRLDPEYCPALYALAACYHAGGEPDQAVPYLEKIIAHDRQWSNYRAWRLLITVQDSRGDKAAALAACRELIKLMPTIEHKCLLAEFLVANNLREETAKLLEQALEDFSFQPFRVRWRDRRWAALAKRLWKQATT